MEYTHGKIEQIKIEEEMKKSYINYAMSVIVSRALPDVRDGLKPAHRRILYAMYEMGFTPDKPYKKSARIVGEVLGKYHPHGDVVVYDTMVRMVQTFSSRYPLIDGHGNFGSPDGDSAAAMRYTEARLAHLSMEMLLDLDKKTVDMGPNFDDSLEQPLVLPSRFPTLLANGTSGIAVGMASNIPPHNLVELIDGVNMLIDNPDITVADLMQKIKGPDFPTGAMILGREGFTQAYETGRGTMRIRSKTRIEKMNNGKMRIIVNELPYQVNKAKMIERIAELVRNKQIDGITDLRDESDRDGTRVVIELRRDTNANVILNQLYKHSQMEVSFGMNMLSLVDGQPQTLTLKQMLYYYIEHQKDVVTRRTKFDLAKAEARAHILEGLRIALDHIDEIIALIRASRDDETARNGLMSRFGLSDKQAQAILDMRLRRLTGLERDKIEAEYLEVIKAIAHLKEILNNVPLLLQIIRDEINAVKAKFGDDRRTEIVNAVGDVTAEDLIAEEDVVITLTHQGSIKRLPLDTYRSQRRGGRGITAMGTREEDFVEHLFITTTHHYICFFTNKGRVYRIKVHEIPEASRQARGLAVVNLISLEADEKVNAVIPIRDFTGGSYLFMTTRAGMVKKTSLSEYASIRSNGLIGIALRDGDELIGVRLTDGKQNVVLGTHTGMFIRFDEKDVRVMGRATQGVKGIDLEEEDFVIGMDIVREGIDILVVTQHGFGKRTAIEEYRKQTRGGKGIQTIKRSVRNGNVVCLRAVSTDDDLMVITEQGIIIRMDIKSISRLGRSTQGVTIIRLDEGDQVVAIARVAQKEPEIE
ncbi:MAG: DNA gyrase subunit A [Bacillota bacterium]|nr:MAG: DNA gyrase subunit A [Bacillota bacterium]MBS3951284.1 DNA gyrase subunit A [Peptococcaceae bacterium]